MNTKDRKTPEEMINEAGNESFNNSGRLGGSFNGIDRIPFVVWSAVAKLMQQYADQEIASFRESDAVEFLHWFHKYYYQDYVKETTKELYAKFKKQSTSPKPTTDKDAIKYIKSVVDYLSVASVGLHPSVKDMVKRGNEIIKAASNKL